MRNRYIYPVIGAFLALAPLAAEEMHFTFVQNMSDHDQKAVGLQNLTGPEQRSLERWIDLWTVKVVNQVLTMGCECDTHECLRTIFNRIPAESWRRSTKIQETTVPMTPETPIQNANPPPQNLSAPQKIWPPATDKYMKPPQPQPGVPLGQPALILENMQNGTYVKLNDGTIWEVSTVDRGTSSVFQPFDQVQLVQSAVPGRFQLIDMTQNTRVEVVKPGTPQLLLTLYKRTRTSSQPAISSIIISIMGRPSFCKMDWY